MEVEVRTELEEGRRENWEALLALCHLTQVCHPTTHTHTHTHTHKHTFLQPLSLKSAYKVWEGLDSETTPPVNLLVGVVSGCGSVEEVKSEVVQWCLGRGVELVIWGIDSPPTLSEGEENSESQYYRMTKTLVTKYFVNFANFSDETVKVLFSAYCKCTCICESFFLVKICFYVIRKSHIYYCVTLTMNFANVMKL